MSCVYVLCEGWRCVCVCVCITVCGGAGAGVYTCRGMESEVLVKENAYK